MNWLHFIGKQYYTLQGFVDEATEIGVNRAVAPNIFKKMNLGDKVFLAHKDGASSKVFGYFTFETITGVSDAIMCMLSKQEDVRPMELAEPGRLVRRGCGYYILEGAFSVDDSVNLMDKLREIPDDELGRVMIGGTFHELSDFNLETDYVLTNIPFRMGFRPFDADTFFYTVLGTDNYTNASGRRPKVRGQFYTKIPLFIEHTEVDASMFQIRDYTLA